MCVCVLWGAAPSGMWCRSSQISSNTEVRQEGLWSKCHKSSRWPVNLSKTVPEQSNKPPAFLHLSVCLLQHPLFVCLVIRPCLRWTHRAVPQSGSLIDQAYLNSLTFCSLSLIRQTRIIVSFIVPHVWLSRLAGQYCRQTELGFLFLVLTQFFLPVLQVARTAFFRKIPSRGPNMTLATLAWRSTAVCLPMGAGKSVCKPILCLFIVHFTI